ncbi:MAG: hypothetical protein KDD49_14380, partial [Bacteroidetes bacterium]|nr:hypothetical protein [Bacteroidota bacterium]
TNGVNGCEATDQVVVTQDVSVPIASAGVDMELTCAVTSVTLDGSGSSTGADYSYSWSGPNGFSSSMQSPSVSAAGTYTLTVTNTVTGCSASDQVLVTEDIALPNVVATVVGQITCSTPTLTLNGTGSSAGTYLWTTADGVIISGATSLQPTVSSAGTYTLTVTSSVNGCSNSASVVVTQDSNVPLADAGADMELTCAVTSVMLDGSGSSTGTNYTYSWSGPNGFSSSAMSPSVSAAGIYTLTVTNAANGCSAMSQVTVTSDTTLPVANAGLDMELTCSVI